MKLKLGDQHNEKRNRKPEHIKQQSYTHKTETVKGKKYQQHVL